MLAANTTLALTALLAEPLRQWPDLRTYLPVWWIEDETTTAAATWALSLAIGQPGKLPTPKVSLSSAQPRVSIFTHLGRDKGGTSPTAPYLPFQPLQLEESVFFPGEVSDAAAYARLLDLFREGLATRQSQTDPETYLISVLDLLQRTTWCIANPYTNSGEADTSLFDLCRVAAALAPCYTAGHQEHKATLISGDLSGVQDFIYTITARGATSGLRGRSLYLQLLTEAIAAYLLNQLQLPPTSLIYAGGGHFYLVAPSNSLETVKSARRIISQILLDHHQGALYLALGTADFAGTDWQPEQFSTSWRNLSTAVSQVKSRRFSELGETLYDQLFQPQGHGGPDDTDCQVCHYEGRDVETELDEAGIETVRKCAFCRSLEELGRDIRSARYLVYQSHTPQTARGRSRWQTILAALGVTVQVDQADPAGDAERATLMVLGDPLPPDETKRQQFANRLGIPVALRTRHFVNVTPLDKGNVISFTELQERATGIHRLGVLRLDVDDLGSLFGNGFRNRGGLVPTVALSWALSLFFEGWVGKLAAEASGERQVIYSIYSGGDDLFIVGAWDVLPQLARNITRDLQRYAIANPLVHASAGITLHGGKYPMYQMARAAADALEQAKNYQRDDQRKNAFTFLGRTFSWHDYETLSHEFNELLNISTIKSILHLLQRFEYLYQDHRQKQLKAGKEPQQIYWGPWHWQSAYFLTRLAKLHETKEREILSLLKRLEKNRFHFIEVIGFVARWVELYVRQSDNEE